MASASVVLSAANGPRVDERLLQRSARMNEDPGEESSPERHPSRCRPRMGGAAGSVRQRRSASTGKDHT